MTESSHQRASRNPGRLVLVAGSGLSVVAILAHLVPAVIGWAQPEIRTVRAVGDLDGLVVEVLERVPADAAVLVDTWQAPHVPADQFLERELAYWIFPRRVYSAAAIRGTKRSIEEFVRTREIGWAVSGKELVEVKPGTVESVLGPLGPPGSDRDATSRSLTPFGPMRYPSLLGWLLVAVAVVVTVAGGWGALVCLGVERQLSSQSERWGWSWLVGLSVTSLVALFMFLEGKPVTPSWLPLLPNLGLLIVGVVLRKCVHGGHVEDVAERVESSSGLLNGKIRLLPLVLFGGAVLIGAARGIDGFDQRMQWGYKARLIQTEPGPWGESVFQDPDHVHFHPRYPLLVPAAEAVFGGVGAWESSNDGRFSESSAVLVFPLTWLALGGVVIGGLRRMKSRDPVMGGVLLLMMPAWCGLGAFQNNLAAFNGCPELVVGVALLSAVVAGLAAYEQGGGWWFLVGLCLVVAGLDKAEGPVTVLVLAGVGTAAAIAHRERRSLGAIVLTVAVVGAVLATHEVVFTRSVVAGVLPDDYRRLLSLSGVADGLVRLPTVATRFLLEVAAAPWFGAIGIVLVVAMVRGREKWRNPAVAWPLVTSVLMLAAYCVPFLVIPDYENNLDWAAGRLVMQIIPLATWSLVVTLDNHRGAADPNDESVDPLAGDSARVGGE